MYTASPDNNSYSCNSKPQQDVVHTGQRIQGAELREYEQQIFEQLQTPAQHHYFVSEREKNGGLPESLDNYLDSVLSTPSESPPLLLDPLENEESFSNALVSDHDILFDAGQ